MKNAIKLAIEGGWDERRWYENHTHICSAIFLDTLFWQALGKAMGWEKVVETHVTDSGKRLTPVLIPSWHYQWLRFIDHLAEGKDADEFFTNLLAQPKDK